MCYIKYYLKSGIWEDLESITKLSAQPGVGRGAIYLRGLGWGNNSNNNNLKKKPSYH